MNVAITDDTHTHTHLHKNITKQYNSNKNNNNGITEEQQSCLFDDLVYTENGKKITRS